jgi:hypothetical protein
MRARMMMMILMNYYYYYFFIIRNEKNKTLRVHSVSKVTQFLC